MYMLSYLLESGGYNIIKTYNGPDGINAALTSSPDLILLDIQLPGIDGYEVARRLRANEILNDVSIVAVSSYALAGDRERAFNSGVNGYFEKPVDPDTFIEEIERFLK